MVITAMLSKEPNMPFELLHRPDPVAGWGAVFPLVTVVQPLAEAETAHNPVERYEVAGRAALYIA